jgi:hypothetical protein
VDNARRSVGSGAVWVVAGSLFGLFGLPVVFADLPDPAAKLIWLGLALATCVCLLPPATMLAKSLARQLHHLPRQESLRESTEIAWLLLAAGYLTTFQAIARRPIVAVFGSAADPFVVEATVGALALLTLLALLAGAFVLGRALLEGTMLEALDALFATTQPSDALSPPSTTAPTDPAPTVAAPRAAAATAAGEKTITARLPWRQA